MHRNRPLDPLGRDGWYRTLFHNQLVTIEVVGNKSREQFDLGEVSFAILSLRRADTNEEDGRIAHRARDVGGQRKTLVGQMLQEQGLKAGLIKWRFAGAKGLDSLRVFVGTNNSPAKF